MRREREAEPDLDTRTVCPYCGGKGEVSVLVNPLGKGYLGEEQSSATWVRRPCPLCERKGHISGGSSSGLAKGKSAKTQELTGRFEQANVLLNELRAIHLWDDNYWRCRRPELYEKLAFLTRQKRRCEIIRQLASFRKAE